jgi:transposase
MPDPERERYERIIWELKEENALLRFELKELKDRLYGRRKKPDPPDPPAQETPVKKRGALFGHLGWFRKKPDKIDKIVEVKLKKCPACGGRDLRECSGTKDHLQEDIVFAEPIVTQYRKRRYYCRKCKKVVTGTGEGEIDRGRIGPLAKSLAAYLKYQVKVSDRDIRKIFSDLFGLKFTLGSVFGFRNQLKARLLPAYEDLVRKIRKSSYVHADETGWKIDGKSSWLWNFSTQRISVCHVDRSRSAKIPKAVLGESFKGTLLSDFYPAYNKVSSGKKQRCLVHLLRDLKRIEEVTEASDPARRFAGRLKALIFQAIELSQKRKSLSKKVYGSKRNQIIRSFEDLRLADPANKVIQRFVNRLDRHRHECLTFLDEPSIPWHNNHAERMIRPNVLLRKITFGNRSIQGAANHNVLMSLLQTAKLKGLDPLGALRELLAKSAYGASAGLSPP